MSGKHPLLDDPNSNANLKMPLFRMNDETMLAIFKQLSPLVFLAIAASNFYSAPVVDTDSNDLTKMFLSILSYGFLPFGLVTIGAAAAAERDRRLIRYSAFFLFGEILYMICLCETLAVQSGANQFAIGVSTLFCLALVLIMWSALFRYPQIIWSATFSYPQDKQLLLDDPNSNTNLEKPMFPMDDETMMSFVKPVSVSAYLGIIVLNYLNAPAINTATNEPTKALLSALLFGFFGFGLFILVVTVAAEVYRPCIGYAAGLILGEIMYIICLDGLLVVVKFRANQYVAGVVTVFAMAITLIIWRAMFRFPQCLRCGKGSRASAATADGDATPDQNNPTNAV